MRILLQCLLFLSCNALAVASEIIAWKTPIAVIAPQGLNVSGVTRLEKPPEASPFFGPKDELWDVAVLMSKPDRVLSDPPEWIVWNATSGYLVAKVSWAAYLEIEYKWELQLPVSQCRVKIDVYDVPADGSPPDSSKSPKHSLSVFTRNGQKTISSNSEGGTTIGLECEANFPNGCPCFLEMHGSSPADLRTLISVTLPDGSTSKFDTCVVPEDGKPLWLARDFDGKNGIDIMLTATSVLVDGTPVSEAIMRQEGNAVMPFPSNVRNWKSDNVAIGEKSRLIWCSIPLKDMFRNFELVKYPEDKKIDDPFAAAGNGEEPEKIVMVDESKLKMITAPEILAPHFRGSVFDLGDLTNRLGLEVPKGDLLGYDYKNQRIFIYSSDMKQLDFFEQLFFMRGHHQPTSLLITARGNGEFRMVSRSGVKSLIESTSSKSKQTRHLQVEPTLGDTDTYVDASFTYQDRIGEQIMSSVNSAATMVVGDSLKLFEKGKADGSKEAIEMKVEILKH
ncbi:MAG: hypothetical protein V4727_01470 [Verrucomicrobiota bacterium]